MVAELEAEVHFTVMSMEVVKLLRSWLASFVAFMTDSYDSVRSGSFVPFIISVQRAERACKFAKVAELPWTK